MGTFSLLPARAPRAQIVCAVCLGALTLAGVAAANEATVVESHIPISATGPNVCTGDVFTGAAFLHTTSHVFLGNNGLFHINLNANVESFQAVSPTGARYVATGASSFEQKFYLFAGAAEKTSLEAHFTAVRLQEVEGVLVTDPEDDLYVRMRVHVTTDASGVTRVDLFEFTTDCR